MAEIAATQEARTSRPMPIAIDGFKIREFCILHLIFRFVTEGRRSGCEST